MCLDGVHRRYLQSGVRPVLRVGRDDPALDSLGRYVKQYGIPLAVYTDKHTTYKSPAQPTVDEQLAGEQPLSQFERSLAE